MEAALSGSAKEKKQLFRPEDEAIGDGHDRSDEDENDESEGDGYSEEESNGGEEDEDALDSDNDVDDNEDTNAPKHNGDAPKFILRTAPAPKRRSPVASSRYREAKEKRRRESFTDHTTDSVRWSFFSPFIALVDHRS